MRKWLTSVLLSIGLGLALAGSGYSTHVEERMAREQPVHDVIISRRVREALYEDPKMRSAAINVMTHSGHVVLRGLVLNRKQAERAVEVARSVPSVKSVRERLVIINRTSDTKKRFLKQPTH
jgi:osmotically-inducible protein OsmY